ncbi:GDYXXLXY domain-containing protein [Hyphomicrobium sp.]|jgi:uncharacterized membrane-anchored protein|uniref:GDYXXLXY domain-containing protein n=1 Tax=Hyphomicrobium sp. TaxID=82 RepID=UPI002BF8E3CA|nr:GDYXXLXY domain-containing protein [Hyphomicrobium sp.]HVZ04279.1 GDYXXLXY domain-containing protein [Hyphomicrobium sp.]
MSGTRRYFWLLLIFVALVQSAALFKMVYDKDRLLKDGREITMPVKPLDPRDLFRGDYVTLGYDITTLNKTNAPEGRLADVQTGSIAFVTLSPKPDGGWTVKELSTTYPKEVASGDVVLKGRVHNAWGGAGAYDKVLNMRYGIETYFVPEGTGRALESKVRDHKIDAIVAVGGDGTAALKGLIVDGERHVDPPLL